MFWLGLLIVVIAHLADAVTTIILLNHPSKRFKEANPIMRALLSINSMLAWSVKFTIGIGIYWIGTWVAPALLVAVVHGAIFGGVAYHNYRLIPSK